MDSISDESVERDKHHTAVKQDIHDFQGPLMSYRNILCN